MAPAVNASSRTSAFATGAESAAGAAGRADRAGRAAAKWTMIATSWAAEAVLGRRRMAAAGRPA